MWYSCYSSLLTNVYFQDECGDWSYDFTKNEFYCLIIYRDFISQYYSFEYWSEIFKYPCFKG